MVLSTVDSKGRPDSRVVLLKGLEEDRFIFFSNYESEKAKQIQQQPYVALNFYWPQMARQVRIKGRVKKLSAELSDRYFDQRPKESQLSALASPQSQEIPNRQFLEDLFSRLSIDYAEKAVIRPRSWGGYYVLPSELEFWQGRDNRLHDRIQFYKKRKLWRYRRLAP